MPDIIRLLPDNIANQIAAGEVVQRPASVVKELLENSIDAGATSIKLIVKDAGRTLIQVVDDGIGMSETDARMSLERHATSKITSFDDLLKISTKGFRGEALASIAAVAQVEMKTKKADLELGTRLLIEASEVKIQEPCSTKGGTSIAVKNLFYNIPARRNFLKSNPVELKHINEEFYRVALAHPEVNFQLVQNDLEVYNLERGKLSRRIVQLLGKNYKEQLITCQEETPDIKVTGYVGKPEFSKKTRGDQYFFINKRYIKNAYLNHAVARAYEGLLKDDYFPFYVLNIEIDPSQVDINVHPTKTEVKFQDDRTLYGVINAAVRQALASFNVTPSLDFSADINFDHFTQQTQSPKPERAISTQERSYGRFDTIDFQKKQSDWKSLYEGVRQEEERVIQQAEKEAFKPEETTVKNDVEEMMSKFSSEYLIRQVKSGLMILDKVATIERIQFEKIHSGDKKPSSQSCLFPQQVRLTPTDYALVSDIQQEISALGFEFTLMHDHSVMIQGVPSDLVPCNEQEIFEGLLEQFKQNAQNLEVPKKEKLERALAKRIAKSMASQVEEDQVDILIDQLFACSQPNYTPGGKPTYVLISLDKINSWFQK